MKNLILDSKYQKNRVAILGNYTINNYYHKTTSEIFNEVGKNTGNQLFRFAIHSHISSPEQIVDFNTDPKYINNDSNILIMRSVI